MNPAALAVLLLIAPSPAAPPSAPNTVDSSSFKEGKGTGDIVHKDATGKVLLRIRYEAGIKAGEEENHADGKLKAARLYDKQGRRDGPSLEWWPNGAMRHDHTWVAGRLQRALDFYPTGAPRLLRSGLLGADAEAVPGKVKPGTMKVGSLEAWAPDGRRSAAVTEGRGQALTFFLEGEKLSPKALREAYRDSLVQAWEFLDTARAYRMLDSIARADSARTGK